MADEANVQDEPVEEPTSVGYQVRDKDGNVVGEWTAPVDGDFKWPRAEKGQTRWRKTGQRWSQVK